MKTTKTILVCVLVTVFGLTSCVKEAIDTPAFESEEVEMTFTTSIPGSSETQSRALTDADEYTVSGPVKVIAFNAAGNFIYARDGAVTGVAANGGNGAGKATITFTAQTSGDADVTFVVIANANTEAAAAITAASTSTSKATFFSNTSLVKTVTAGTAWTAASIPMHGEVTTKVAVGDAAKSITLKRMLARITVKSTPATTSVAGSFRLKSVNLFNVNSSGFIAPGQTAQSGWAYLQASGSIPYTLTSDETTAKALERTIYTFERTVPAASPVILVIGGEYGASSSTTYYKVELMDGATPYNMTRNSSYNVTINSVSGPGFPEIPDVFTSTTTTMSASISAWVDENISVDLDGI